MGAVDEQERDRFFGEIYRASTEPFLTPAMTAAEVRSFVELVRLPAGARVLDLGCGWGRHLAPLAARGLSPVGLDRSGPYCVRAHAETGRPVVRGDVRALPFRDASLGAVGCFYSSIFFFEDEGNAGAVREVARVLKPGGAFVLQSANPMHLRRLGTEERAVTLAGGVRVWEQSRFDGVRGLEHLHRRVSLADGSILEGSFAVRHYARGELEVLAWRAGLKLEKVFGDLSHGPFERRSRELVAVLRRP